MSGKSRNQKAKVNPPRKQGKKTELETTRRSSAMVSVFAMSPKGEFRRHPGKGPGMIQSSKILSKKVLYNVVENALLLDFLIQDGHNQFLMCTSSALVAGGILYSEVDCWRIRRIKFYLLNNEAGESVKLIFTPRGFDTSNFLTDIDAAHVMVSESDAIPSVFSYTPKPFHPCGMWHKTTTDNPTGSVFLLQASAEVDRNSYIEIDYEYVLNTTGAPHGYTATSTNPVTVGTLYQGCWGAGNNVRPVGMNACFVY